MVRPAFIANIRAVLGESRPFAVADFNIFEGVTEGHEEITIVYSPAPKNSFQFRIVHGAHGQSPALMFTARPGDVSAHTSGTTGDGDQLFNHIRAWLERVNADLLTVPQQRQIAEQHEHITRLMETVGNLPDAYYTRQEAADLAAKLEALQQELHAHIRATTDNEERVEQQLREVDGDIADLKVGLATLTQSGWMRSLATRFARWTLHPGNRELLEAGTQFGTLLLSEGTKKLSQGG